MYNFTEVDAYLNQLSGADDYLQLPYSEREKLAFTAYETLAMHYREKLLTTRVVALQALYMTEGTTNEETAALRSIRAAGAKSYSIEGVAVTFDDNAPTGISPAVVAILQNASPGAYVGRLI